MSPQDLAEVSSIHGFRGNRDGPTVSEVAEAVTLITKEKESMLFPDGSAERAAEIVFLLVVLGCAKRVGDQSRGIELGVFIVVK